MLKTKIKKIASFFCGNKQRGSILAYSLIIISVMVIIVSSISVVTVIEKKGAVSTDSSVQAYQTADSGLQLAIKKINQNIFVDPATTITEAFLGNCLTGKVKLQVPAISGSDYVLSFKDSAEVDLDCSREIQDIRKIKSVGTYKNTVRAVEVSVSGINCDADTVCGTSCRYNGDEYSTVELGTQCWFQENLRTKKKPDGTDINSTNIWNPDNDASNVADYGLLYQWHTANSLPDSCGNILCSPPSPYQGICPTGWHIPTVDEFQTLRSTQGNNLRDVNKFNGVLAGFIIVNPGGFGQRGLWWSSNESNAADAQYLNLYDTGNASMLSFNKNMAASVRCLQD